VAGSETEITFMWHSISAWRHSEQFR